MITISQLNISYSNQKRVIDTLQLNMKESCIHGIVGLNGAGKTTLLNAIFGLIKPDSGEILFRNTPLKKIQMSYLTTESFFYSNISGREYLMLFKNEDFKLEKWNELFLLPLDQIIEEYSTGMRKKLALMGILKQNKPVMILDEPFNGLDLETCRIIRSILLKMKENGKTIVITSHIIETLTNLCDFIHYLEKGKIKSSQTKENFEAFERAIFEELEKKNEALIDELTK